LVIPCVVYYFRRKQLSRHFSYFAATFLSRANSSNFHGNDSEFDPLKTPNDAKNKKKPKFDHLILIQITQGANQ